MAPTGKKTGPETIQRRENMARALQMRKEGKSYDEIAKALGYANKGSAYHLVKDAIKEVTREPAQEVLTLELERLDAMLETLFPAATDLSRPDNLFPAVDRVLRIMDRRAKYLGLDGMTDDGTDTAKSVLGSLMDSLRNLHNGGNKAGDTEPAG